MLALFITFCIITVCFFIVGIVAAICAIKSITNKSSYFILSFTFIMLTMVSIYGIFNMTDSIKPANFVTTNSFTVQKNCKIGTIETRGTSPDKLVVYIEDEPIGTIPLNNVEIGDTDEVTYNTVKLSISKLKISEDTAIKLGIMSEKVKVNAEN